MPLHFTLATQNPNSLPFRPESLKYTIMPFTIACNLLMKYDLEMTLRALAAKLFMGAGT